MSSNQNLPVESYPPNRAGAQFQVSSSESLPASERYEYWLQSQLIGVKALAPSVKQRRDYRGRLMSLTSPDFEVHVAELDDFEAVRSERQRRTDGDENLALMFVMQGALQARYPDGQSTYAGPGQFLMLDARRAYRVRMARSQVVQLTLPRPALHLLPAHARSDEAVQSMMRHPLSCLLALQLRECRELLTALDAPGRAALLDTTSSLVMAVLRTVCASESQLPRSEHLYVAAQEHIHRCLDDPELNVRNLAKALGCSRTSLYEAFAAQGQSVAGHIREMRLQAVARLLRQNTASVSIADLAHQCGLQDPSNFSRMFRRRFRVSPQVFRVQHRGQAE